MEKEHLIEILAAAVGKEKAETAYDAFQLDPSVSIRLNPFKVTDFESFMSENFDSPHSQVAWSPAGFFLEKRPLFTLDPTFHAGCYYVQDSSAMVVGHIFREQLKKFDDVERPLRVLDLCAAPGGKTTDLAASLRQARGDQFLLVANEVMRNRASVLAENVALWGDPNVVVTCLDPKAFARLKSFFDIIVADVPCSGEGMFRKDEKAVEDWSEDVVSLCASRQKRILADVWPSLASSGVLVYSTCTFAEEENDANVEWTASELGGEVIGYDYASLQGVIPTRCGGLLVPGFVKGEGQYVAALEKTSGQEAVRIKGKTATEDKIVKKEDLQIRIPSSIVVEADALEPLHPIRTGLATGMIKGKDFVPSADLALCFGNYRDSFPVADLSKEDALKFLHRDAVSLADAPKGYVMVRYDGHPLGFVKNLGNRCNNMHPQGRRIRMNIEG